MMLSNRFSTPTLPKSIKDYVEILKMYIAIVSDDETESSKTTFDTIPWFCVEPISSLYSETKKSHT